MRVRLGLELGLEFRLSVRIRVGVCLGFVWHRAVCLDHCFILSLLPSPCLVLVLFSFKSCLVLIIILSCLIIVYCCVLLVSPCRVCLLLSLSLPRLLSFLIKIKMGQAGTSARGCTLHKKQKNSNIKSINKTNCSLSSSSIVLLFTKNRQLLFSSPKINGNEG